MNNIYDNGVLVLGNIKDCIKQVKKDSDLCVIDQEELLKDLKKLEEIDNNMIVCINYDNGTSYSIDYWDSRDIVRDDK